MNRNQIAGVAGVVSDAVNIRHIGDRQVSGRKMLFTLRNKRGIRIKGKNLLGHLVAVNYQNRAAGAAVVMHGSKLTGKPAQDQNFGELGSEN